jgi:hypothetical protein
MGCYIACRGGFPLLRPVERPSPRLRRLPALENGVHSPVAFADVLRMPQIDPSPPFVLWKSGRSRLVASTGTGDE